MKIVLVVWVLGLLVVALPIPAPLSYACSLLAGVIVGSITMMYVLTRMLYGGRKHDDRHR